MLFCAENRSEKKWLQIITANNYLVNGFVRLSCNKISNGRVQKVPHISYLFEHFLDFDFGLEHNDNENADESGSANESLQSSY